MSGVAADRVDYGHDGVEQKTVITMATFDGGSSEPGFGKVGVIKAEAYVIGVVSLLKEHGDRAMSRINQGLSGIDRTERSKFISLFEKESDQENLPYKLLLSADGNLEIERK